MANQKKTFDIQTVSGRKFVYFCLDISALKTQLLTAEFLNNQVNNKFIVSGLDETVGQPNLGTNLATYWATQTKY